MPLPPPYIANTDKNWFDFLTSIAALDAGGRRTIPEANFWFPNAQSPHVKALSAGTPVFFRLKKPNYAVAGVGFFAAYHMLTIDDAWGAFGVGNGDASYGQFARRILSYRTGRKTVANESESDHFELDRPLACMILRGVEFWAQDKWIPWGEAQGFAAPIVTGKFENDAMRAARLEASIGSVGEIRAAEFAGAFRLVDADGRRWREQSAQAVREGQSSFRLRLLDVYGSQCAITGEHTLPVLDAAHIQPYLGRASNHIQNGIVLTKEFHTLFDKGYVTVTPDLRVRISERLKRDFSNGRRYYPYDGQPLAKLPDDAVAHPSRDALDWHARHVFRAG